MSRKSAVFVFGLLLAAGAAWAQSITGSVIGVVRDPSGAVVTGAEVRLTNNGTGVTQRTTTDDAGTYRFLLLPSGVYRIESRRPGVQDVPPRRAHCRG